MLSLYKKLESSKIFKDWKNKHKDSFLCSYIVIDKTQFDFYNKNDTITSFTVDNNIEIKENEKIFKKTELKELDLNNIKLKEKDAIEIVNKKYSKETFNKKIIILQNTEEPFWNLTFITASLKILNVKIDMNKKIIQETFEPLTNLMKTVK
tara:strand:- start:1416 stop:1868 length:453 start_codon:yes stop_codon:yes gene_type:complete